MHRNATNTRTSERRRRLLLLLLLTCTTASACTTDYVEPIPLPRARQVRQKRLRGMRARLLTEARASRCLGNAGQPLPEPQAPLVLPQGKTLALALPPQPAPLVARLGDGPCLALSRDPLSPQLLFVTLPDHIAAGSLTVTSRGKTLWKRRVFLTHQAPLNPQTPPWEGVLADACSWAHGARTQTEILEALTKGLFESGKFVYPVKDPTKLSQYVYHDTYDLSGLFAHLGPSFGNCVDVACYLVLCARALGIPLTTLQLTDAQERALQTNPVCPIGWDPTDPESYQVLELERHQLAYLPETNRLYDPCLLPLLFPTDRPERRATGGWEAAHLTGYWQGFERTSGLIQPQHQSEPKIVVQGFVPGVR